MTEPNFFAATAKRVSKITSKAKAALEEKSMWHSSNKRKPEMSRTSIDTISPVPKKMKANPPTDTAPVVLPEDEGNASKKTSSDDDDKTPKDKLKRLMKDWTSPVYAFFDPTPTIEMNED
ncbi:hypothetical protein CY34DRAFT_13655 [Suillus luteus UH-Slu-Lm8-n1]|uniref:Unplaced genomic scaffold CY34scaffold_168, whole genome shotgun sequence n=1 Tax=Suillus luteus UH-Slu-Lm8-n1 TaxID=930992 RepID=A0A0D0B231_9AGAM|nr:hypothetical protein CY34DRAFT_13655 [Suillus luteus UH-Slu-Lm8-n1]